MNCNCPYPGVGNEYKCDDAQATPFPSHCHCECHKEKEVRFLGDYLLDAVSHCAYHAAQLPDTCQKSIDLCRVDAMPKTAQYASKSEVADLSKQVSALSKDARDGKANLNSFTQKLESVNTELRRKPNASSFYIVFGLVLTVVLAVSGWVLVSYFTDHLPVVVDSKLAPITERIAKIETALDPLSGVNDRVGKIEAKLDLLLSGVIKKPTSGNPSDVKTKLIVAQDILANAEKRGVVFEPQSIQDGGLELIRYKPPTSDLEPIVWDTVTRYVDYRSFLNQKLSPVPVPANPTGTAVRLPRKGLVLFQRNIDVNVPQGLDNGNWVDSVFINCVLTYDGREMRLENVRFQDCQFQIAATPNGKKFAQALLRSNSVTGTWR